MTRAAKPGRKIVVRHGETVTHLDTVADAAELVLLIEAGKRSASHDELTLNTYEKVLRGAGSRLALGRKATTEEVRRALLAEGDTDLAKRWAAFRAGRRLAAHPDPELLIDVLTKLEVPRPSQRVKEHVTDLQAELPQDNIEQRSFLTEASTCVLKTSEHDKSAGKCGSPHSELLNGKDDQPATELGAMVVKAKTAPLIDFKTEETQSSHYKADEPCVLTTSEYSEHDASATIEDDDNETAVSPLRKADSIVVLTTSEYDSSATAERKELDKVERNTLQLEPLMKLMKEVLGDKVEQVVNSSGLADAPCAHQAVLDKSDKAVKDRIQPLFDTSSLTSGFTEMVSFDPEPPSTASSAAHSMGAGKDKGIQGKAKGKGRRSVLS